MTSCKHIITLALSKLGVASALKGARPEDLALGLSTLQAQYRSMISTGTLGKARVVMPTADYTARPNDKVFKRGDAPISVTLPDTVTPHHRHTFSGFYDECHNRPEPPRDGSFVVINDAETGRTEEWIYEGYTNRWVSVFDLSLNEYAETRDENNHVISVQPESTAPLSFQDENGLAAHLAVSLADHYGAQLSPSTIRDAGNWQVALVSRYGERERREEYDHMDRFF